jgi:hypothetical protein
MWGKAGSNLEEIFVLISKVRLESTQRKLDEEHIGKLMRQIGRLGLVAPIMVRKTKGGYVCIEGAHRLEACRRLGERRIKARIFSGPKLQRLLLQWVADDGLRHTALERAERLARIVDVCVKQSSDDVSTRTRGAQRASWQRRLVSFRYLEQRALA